MTDNVDPAAIIAKGTRCVHAEDERIVGYSVTGSTRADARTVVAGYFPVAEEPASWTAAYGSLNVRMINVSLPGLGMSSLHPGRRVADWPSTNLDPILEAEGVEDFHVYGVSYGTIHALAVAQHHGPDRVRTMGLRVPYFGLSLRRTRSAAADRDRGGATQHPRGTALARRVRPVDGPARRRA